MILPGPSESRAVFERVFGATKSIDAAIAAVVEHAVTYRDQFINSSVALRRAGVLADLPRDGLPKLVIETVCEFLGVSTVALLGGIKARQVSYARRVIGWLLVDAADVTFREARDHLNLGQHSVVWTAVREMRRSLARDKGLATEVEAIVSWIRERAAFAQRRAA